MTACKATASLLIRQLGWMMTAACLLVTGPALSQSTPIDSAPSSDRIPPIVDDAALHYIGSVEILPETGSLVAGWTIVISDPALSRFSFGLSSALGTARIDGSDVQSVRTELDPDFGGTKRLYHVDLAAAPAGRDRVVKLAYAGPLFGGAQTFSVNTINPDKVELTADSFWFPFDVRFDTNITAQLFVRVRDDDMSGDWSAVGLDHVERKPDGFLFRQDDPAFDIVFALLSDPVLVKKPGYVVYDTRSEPGVKLPALARALESCTKFLNDLAGPAGPLPQASVIVTDRVDGSYSRKTLISLSDIENEDTENLQQFICHELAHYWSQANAGGPENWINEGVADYLGNMAIRAALGEAVFQARMSRYAEQLSEQSVAPIWTAQATQRPDYWIMYRAAPLALRDLEARMGRAAFADFMRAVMVEETPTTPDLLALLARLNGVETRNWFEARLAE